MTLKRGLFGYRRGPVDGCSTEIARRFEDVWRERADLADRVEQLEGEIERHRELEALLRTTLVSAERAAHELRDQAKREADPSSRRRTPRRARSRARRAPNGSACSATRARSRPAARRLETPSETPRTARGGQTAGILYWADGDARPRVRLRVSPGADTELAGRHGDGWKVRVAAPPERGRANDAVLDLLAERLGLPRAL